MKRIVKSAGKKLARALYSSDYGKLIKLGALERPNYAYIVFNAAQLAKRLGISRISVIEIGVAGGRGLLALEAHAKRVEELTGVQIEAYGFDTGEGLPPPADYRDLPYIWQEAHFRMDHAALSQRLRRAKLVLGDVKDTMPEFFDNYNPAPIGAIAFDLDYYSSTMDAFRLFDGPSRYFLPRVLLYFDDVYSSDIGHVGHAVGVPRAIADFNALNPSRQLSYLNHLEFDYGPARKWHRQIYSFSDFRHPDADHYILKSDRQLSL
jgi:hypothetical protein